MAKHILEAVLHMVLMGAGLYGVLVLWATL